MKIHLILYLQYFIIRLDVERIVVIYGNRKRASGWCKLAMEIYELDSGVFRVIPLSIKS